MVIFHPMTFNSRRPHKHLYIPIWLHYIKGFRRFRHLRILLYIPIWLHYIPLPCIPPLSSRARIHIIVHILPYIIIIPQIHNFFSTVTAIFPRKISLCRTPVLFALFDVDRTIIFRQYFYHCIHQPPIYHEVSAHACFS